MKKITFSLVLLAFASLMTAEAQSIQAKSPTIMVDFAKSSGPKIEFFKPDVLASTRGFKKVKAQSIELEGVITDDNGINSLEINDRIIDIHSNGYFSTSLPLRLGDNQLVFHIVNGENKSFEKTYVIEREKGNDSSLDDRIIGYLGDKKYYALLIGVNDYDDSKITSLDQPINDALKFKEVLMEHYTFEEDYITVLSNPTRTDIIESFDYLSKNVDEDDNLLIFYAGHGIWDEGLKQGYWLPKDSKKDSKAAWLSNGTIRDYIGGIKSKNTLLVADACFSGGIFKTRGIDMQYRGVLELYKLPSRKAITSGNMTTVPDQSVFMKYLLKRLVDNKEHYINSAKLFESFKVAVINNSGTDPTIPQYGTVQDAGDEGGDFIFILK